MAMYISEKEIGKNYKWIVFSCTTLGTLLMALSANMMVVALPVITRDLQTSIERVVWTLMIYTLTVTIFVPSIGRVADMYGRKRLFILGLMVFTAGSFLCGLSNNFSQLVAARFIQSIGGSLIMTNNTAILTDIFPSNELGRALGLSMAVFSLGMIVGPAIGGFLTSYSWRWIFFSNVPFGIAGTIWAIYHLRELMKPKRREKFDWAGTTTFTLGLFSILVVLTTGHIWGWHSFKIVLLCITGIILLMVFVIIENKIEHPMLDLALFKTRFLAAAFTSNFLNGLTQGSVIFLLTFYFQNVRGFAPVQVGVFLIPFAVSMLILSPISGVLSDRFGSRELSSLGFLVRSVGFYGLSRINFETPVPLIIFLTIIIGIGTGLYISPNSNAIMGAVPPERRGIAAGTRVMMNNAGMVGSIAISTAITGASTMETSRQIITGNAVQLDFLHGLQHAFVIFFFISLLGASISFARGNITNNNKSLLGEAFLEKTRPK